MRPIDADALMDLARNHVNRTVDCNDIARFPTLDYEPVKHGNWGPPEIIGYDGIHAVYGAPCSECGTCSREYYRLFCSNCGAKMGD